jgi:hypothetical protein
LLFIRYQAIPNLAKNYIVDARATPVKPNPKPWTNIQISIKCNPEADESEISETLVTPSEFAN